MDIKLELISGMIADIVTKSIEDICADADKIIQTKAISVLSEIQKNVNKFLDFIP